MSFTPIDGKQAAGNLVTWVIPAAVVTAEPDAGSWDLAYLSDPTTVKVDCYMDFGDVTTTFSPTTTTKQRMCEKIARTVQTGETIDVTLAGVYDQQTAMTETVNLFYATVPTGADVYIARAYGWDSDNAADATTIVDVFKGKVQRRTKTEPTAADEDLKFNATVSVEDYFEDVTLTTTP